MFYHHFCGIFINITFIIHATNKNICIWVDMKALWSTPKKWWFIWILLFLHQYLLEELSLLGYLWFNVPYSHSFVLSIIELLLLNLQSGNSILKIVSHRISYWSPIFLMAFSIFCCPFKFITNVPYILLWNQLRSYIFYFKKYWFLLVRINTVY